MWRVRVTTFSEKHEALPYEQAIFEGEYLSIKDGTATLYSYMYTKIGRPPLADASIHTVSTHQEIKIPLERVASIERI